MLSLAAPVSPADKYLSLEFTNANVADVCRLIAKMIHVNVVISPAVNGIVTLHLQHALALEAFDLLLASQGLSKYQSGNIWFIAPRTELARRVQDELKLQQVTNESAPLTARVWQIHYARAEDVARMIQDSNHSLLSKRGSVRVDMRTNILCIQDVESQFADIDALIKRLDIPVQQVLIEARLASIDSECERELGINFNVRAAHNLGAPPENKGRYSLAAVVLPDTSVLDVQLAALEQAGHGELISSPSLFTANQQLASIESGEEIPYQETAESGATSVTFKKAVLSLKVIPQVLPGNRVMLRLHVTQDRPTNRLVLGVPAISTRQISTNILVAAGQTIVLGGIYESNSEYSEQRIPFLGKIPLVGNLFQQHNSQANKRELLIFVTPKIIAQTRDRK